MKYEPVTVQHPLIEPGNDEAIDELERRLVDSLKKWTNHNKLTAEGVSQRLCETILVRVLRKAVSLITAEEIAKIHGEASAPERKKLVRHICDGLSDSVRRELMSMSGLPRPGRRRQYVSRDRTKEAVQAAYRREKSDASQFAELIRC
jgi:hypothetical protein